MKWLMVVLNCIVMTGALQAQLANAKTTFPASSSTSQIQQDEVKVAPGAVLMAWKGKNVLEAEIAAKVDTGKEFSSRNINSDPIAASTNEKLSKWTGILNVTEPGLYTFSIKGYGVRDSTSSLFINGTQIFSGGGDYTSSKNVQLPGPVTMEVIIYSNYTLGTCNNGLFIRFKKAGTLSWTVITPEMLLHKVQ